MSTQTQTRILAVNCGNAHTSALLIEYDDAAETHRLKATHKVPSTHIEPWSDITLGVQEVIRGLEQATGRTLLTSGGRPITPRSIRDEGVDHFVAVASAGEPMPMVLVGLIEQISLQSARRAAATTYTYLTSELCLDEVHTSQLERVSEGLRDIQNTPPEVILFVGGTDDGAQRPVVDMANLVAMALRVLPEGRQPAVIFAGNKAMRSKVAELVGPSLISVDNVRPDLEHENLAPTQVELERLYIQRRMARLPKVEVLNNWTSQPISPVSKSFEKLITYLGQHNQLSVIGADVGSRSTLLSVHTPTYHGSTIRTDAGVGHSLGALLNQITPEAIQRWLPYSIDVYDLHNQLLSRAIAPTSVPVTAEQLWVEYAIARESLRLTAQHARQGWPSPSRYKKFDFQWNLIIAAGQTLGGVPQLGHAVSILLDGLEPWGIASLALDQNGVSAVIGAVAAVAPRAAVEVTAQDTFLNLGTVIAPTGYGTAGKTALKLKLIPDEGEIETHDVPYGVIQRLPLAPGEKATVEVLPTGYLDMLPNNPGQGVRAEVSGGVLGLIIDTRGRPLRLPTDDEARIEQLQQWYQALEIS